jgi:hypothetical protein
MLDDKVYYIVKVQMKENSKKWLRSDFNLNPKETA